ncbi:MAG: metallophosphoesterase [Deltaproteobacteria bacterium]|nr:metallophosphoesterase [Deltaproteobacteria bacterium]
MVLVIYSARGFSTPSPEFNRKILKYSSVAILIAAGAGVFFGIHQATDTLKINEVTIVDSNLPEKFSGFKIVLLSDLHVGPTLKTDFVKKIVAKTNEAEPDIIVIAGDLVDGPWHKVAGMLKPMKNFNAPVYFSPGNHELYWKFNTWKKNLQKTGIHILSESYTIIKKNSEKLLLGGIPDVFRWSGGENFNYRGPERIIKKAPPSDYRILIAHRPSIAKNAFKAGFNLMLSGHTHGGQTFPITLLGLINRNLGHGLFRHEGLHYYVSSGAGFWGPPVRLFNSPEIVVITLKTH